MIQPAKPTVGEKLRRAREGMGISLEDAARATHIRLNYLQELENDHPEMFTSSTQARGFLRLYASFLNLPESELIDQWESPGEAYEESQSTETTFDVEKDDNDQKSEFFPEEPVSLSTSIKPEEKTKKESEQQVTLREKVEKILGNIKTSLQLSKFKELLQIKKHISEKRGSLPPPQIISSDDIFTEIGEALRGRRQKLDLDLTDVEHFTNIKRMYLIAIEDGRFNDLPSTVQGRGMLNNYVQFLAMDDTPILDQYAQALQLQREERMPPVGKTNKAAVSVSVNFPEGIRRLLNADMIVGGALILALFGFILWGASQILGSSGEETNDAPSISEMLQATPSVTPSADLTTTAEENQPAEVTTPIPGVAIAEATPTPVATVNSAPLQLYIIANDRAYMRITVDGTEEFDGRVAPDNVYTYSGNNLITLLTGNASALEIYFNQEYLGKLGDVGEVKDFRFSLSGLTTPTPAATQTPTLDPRAMEEEGVMMEGN